MLSQAYYSIPLLRRASTYYQVKWRAADYSRNLFPKVLKSMQSLWLVTLVAL